MPTAPQVPYPRLAAFLGGWLHQDFDLEGETLAEVVAAYRRVSTPAERAGVRAEIDRFLRTADAHRIDAEFEATFAPDVDPRAFAADAGAFLGLLGALLADPPPGDAGPAV